MRKDTANGNLGGGLGSGVTGSLMANSQERAKMMKHLGPGRGFADTRRT